MYVSKLFVKNFRSIQQAVIKFDPGKNVLVGKNNSGKSNIIKGLSVLLGESFPTYLNFSDNDFYTYENPGEEVIAESFMIEATLEGQGVDENLIGTIKKKTAFSRLRSIQEIYRKDEKGIIHVNFDFILNLDEIERRQEIETLWVSQRGAEIKTEWKSSDQLIEFFKDAELIKIFFAKSREEDLTGHGLIIQDKAGMFWISHFMRKQMRNALITTAVIDAMRNPKNDLRLVHYSWYGKLVKNLWDQNKVKTYQKEGKSYEEIILGKTDEIKLLTDEAEYMTKI